MTTFSQRIAPDENVVNGVLLDTRSFLPVKTRRISDSGASVRLSRVARAFVNGGGNVGGGTNQGAGAFNQTVEDSDQWAIMASPSFEVGSRFALSETYQLRGYARAGVTFSSADDWTTKARFTAAPAGARTFDVTLPMDDVFGRISLGAEPTNLNNGMHLRAEYDGAFSENTASNSGMVRFSYDF